MIVVIGIGAITGYFSSDFFGNRSPWFLGNILIGIIGSCIGYWIFRKIGLPFEHPLINNICSGAIGAIVTLEMISVVYFKLATLFKSNISSQKL